MHSISTTGATGAPSPKTLQAARVEAAGVSPSLAVALADLWFPATKRDDVSALMVMTSARCAAAGVGARS